MDDNFLSKQASKQGYNALIDIFRFVASILIIGSHSLPIFYNDTLNYYYGQWFFRFCVPFFMIVSGYYFSKSGYQKKVKQVKRIFLMLTAVQPDCAVRYTRQIW